MKFIISGRNIDVTEGLKEKITKKISKLEKFFNQDTEIHATLSVEKNNHVLDVNVNHNGFVFRVEEKNIDMYAAIDKAVDVLEAQVVKHKEKHEKNHHKAGGMKEIPVGGESELAEEKFKITQTRKYSVKPMTIEEALMQMEKEKHEFFVFANSQTNKVNMIHKLKTGELGLVEPEF